jgi:hypothetical protein
MRNALDEHSKALAHFKENNANIRVFEAMIDTFGRDMPISTLIGIGNNIKLFEILLATECEKFSSVEEVFISADDDSILVYVSELRVYCKFKLNKYIEFVTEIEKNQNIMHGCANIQQLVSSKEPQKFMIVYAGEETEIPWVRCTFNTLFSLEITFQKVGKLFEITADENLFNNYKQHNTKYINLVNSRRLDDKLYPLPARYYRNDVEYFMPTIYIKGEKEQTPADIIRGIKTSLAAKIEFTAPTIHVQNILPTEPFDICPYKDKCCLYFLQMNEPYTDSFKYGITCHIKSRLKEHQRVINYLRVVKIFVMKDEAAMRTAEKEYKKHAKQTGIAVVRLKYTEVVQTTNMNKELNALTQIVNRHNSDEHMQMIRMVSEIELANRSEHIIPVIVEHRKFPALDWIKNNPPASREKTTSYFKRYTNAEGNEIISGGQFGKLVRSLGYKTMQGPNHRFWVKN